MFKRKQNNQSNPQNYLFSNILQWRFQTLSQIYIQTKHVFQNSSSGNILSQCGDSVMMGTKRRKNKTGGKEGL